MLTVLANDPESVAPPGGWDGRAGFRSEGDAASARRDEDARACAALGAKPRWLPFGDGDYDRHGTDDEVRAAVAEAVGDAGTLLLPGSPLSHPDHEWLVRTVADASLGARRLGLYAEQPYTARTGERAGDGVVARGRPRREALLRPAACGLARPAREAAGGPRLRVAAAAARARPRSVLRLILRPELVAWVGGSENRAPH